MMQIIFVILVAALFAYLGYIVFIGCHIFIEIVSIVLENIEHLIKTKP